MPMIPTSNATSWGALKDRLSKASPAQLLHLIRDLHALSSENRHFLEARFLPTDGQIEHYRRQVEEAIYPDPLSQRRVSITRAKRAIREYERATGDAEGAVDLRLTFVEQGTAQAVDLGFGDDDYFGALERMLETVLRALRHLPPPARGRYMVRLRRLRDTGGDLGWGYGDVLRASVPHVLSRQR